MHPSSFGCDSRRRPPDRDPEERQRRLELVSGGHLNAPPLPSVDTDRLTRGVRVLTVFPSPPLDLTWGFVVPALGSANLRAGLRKERVRAPLDPMLTPAIRPDGHGRGRAPRGDAPCRRPGGEYARAPRRDGCAHGCGWRGDVPSSLPDGGSASRGSACGDASGRRADDVPSPAPSSLTSSVASPSIDRTSIPASYASCRSVRGNTSSLLSVSP